jgi:hypothetical protein
MTFETFAFWLHGYFEISGSNNLNDTQVQIIKDHLDLCFNKVTPDRNPMKDFTTEEIQEVIKKVRKDSTRYCQSLDTKFTGISSTNLC